MIMRIFQVATPPGKEEEFGSFFDETAILLMIGGKGILQLLTGSPRADSPREFWTSMVWENLDARMAFVGHDNQSPHIDPVEPVLIGSRKIKHYDLVEN